MAVFIIKLYNNIQETDGLNSVLFQKYTFLFIENVYFRRESIQVIEKKCILRYSAEKNEDYQQILLHLTSNFKLLWL